MKSDDGGRMVVVACNRKNVKVNAVNPGVCTSALSLGLGFDLDRSEEAATSCAEGPVCVALGPL